MGIYKIKITDRYLYSLNAIADFLGEDDNARYAKYVCDKIDSKILTLENLPRRYPPVWYNEESGLEYRGMCIFSYIIVYEVMENPNLVKVIDIIPAKFGMDYVANVIDTYDD